VALGAGFLTTKKVGSQSYLVGEWVFWHLHQLTRLVAGRGWESINAMYVMSLLNHYLD